MTLKVGIAGGLGRMGRLLVQEALDSPQVSLTCVSGRCLTSLKESLPKGCQAILTESSKTLVENSEIIMDFTIPELSLRHVHDAIKIGKKLVIGTTGFSPEQQEDIRQAASCIPILQASNTSLGIAILGKIAPLVKEALGPDFDIDIRDAHHRNKKDSPSGTALNLISKMFPDQRPRLVSCPSRERTSEDVGMSISRGGGVIGDHDITFTSAHEMITLSHRALDRRLFAVGALKAALWLSQQKPGLYSMDNVTR